jgi:hypothetical protein
VRTVGLVGLALSVACLLGFVTSTARADGRLRDEPTVADLSGARRVWLLAGLLLGVGSLLLLTGDVLG